MKRERVFCVSEVIIGESGVRLVIGILKLMVD
jgi:hypothetical protein